MPQVMAEEVFDEHAGGMPEPTAGPAAQFGGADLQLVVHLLVRVQIVSRECLTRRHSIYSSTPSIQCRHFKIYG